VAKRLATQGGIGFTELSKGFAATCDLAVLQEICDRLGPGTITAFISVGYSNPGPPLPFTEKDWDAGYWWETLMRQIEISGPLVFDVPR